MMSKKIKIAWRSKPVRHDYAAAETYLSLIFAPKITSDLVGRLRKAPIVRYMARDILRATSPSILGIKNSDEERKDILGGAPISPVLLIRYGQIGTLIIADGYHRTCTIYSIDEDAIVHCKIA